MTLTPIERAGGTKAVFVRRGRRVFALEVRARLGYDATQCETGVLAYEVDQTPFKRGPVQLYAAGSDQRPPTRNCSTKWNAPFKLGRGETRTLRLSSLRVRFDVLARLADDSYRVRVVTQ